MNKQNNKQYALFSQNNPTLRKFISLSVVDFHIAQVTPFEERPGIITDSSFTGFLFQQMEFMQKVAKLKNVIIER